MKFEELSYPEAPRISTDIPGVKAKVLLKKQQEIEGSAVSYPRSIPLVLKEGRGATVKDADDNILIDLFSGAGVLALGHCNPVITEAVRKQQDKITHTLDFPTETRLELIEQINNILPREFRNKVRIQFGGPTGSDAVEMAIKLTKYNTKRFPLIAFQGSYHGMTAGASSVTSGKFWKEKYIPLLPEVHFVPYAYCYRCSFNKKSDDCNLHCATYFESILADPHSGVSKPAATIIEPIQGEGGSIVPPDNFIKAIADISRKYEIPIIIDEIQAGFCRTGEFFSFQHSKATPDVITMSKALGGGFPLSAIAYREELDVWKKGAHIGTFRGNVTAMAAGIASINFMVENDLASYSKEIGDFILKNLERSLKDSSIIGDVRGKGMMIGLEIVNDKDSKKPDSESTSKIRMECFKRGVIVEDGGHYNNVVRLLPPLIITKELAKVGTDRIIEAVESVENMK
jgi:diaminobutyrate-2-oxoglutarate transaminase